MRFALQLPHVNDVERVCPTVVGVAVAVTQPGALLCQRSDGVCLSAAGGEALVSCGMMESLLKVINWYGEGQEHITVSVDHVVR